MHVDALLLTWLGGEGARVYNTRTSDRKKYDAWYKKFTAHEQMQMEYEIAADDSPDLAKFKSEVDEKVQLMLDFKKTWLKFVMQTDAYLKKDDILPDVGAR